MKNKILDIFKNFGIESSALSDEAHFVRDLGLDSLDMVDLIMQLEQTFGIAIPDEDYSKITNLKSLVSYLEEHQSVAA